MCPVLRSRTRKYFTHVSCAQVSALAPVAQRIEFEAALLVNRFLHKPAPKYISHMLVPHEPFHTLRTSGTGLLLVPESGLNMENQCFSFLQLKPGTFFLKM
ncbi:hypothetical protein NQD34_015181 [Periophthalmus magnuspinnatus]|nr:hypothetical protein NQD34_015181 [Periophthalmus magnuspinnatus]